MLAAELRPLAGKLTGFSFSKELFRSWSSGSRPPDTHTHCRATAPLNYIIAYLFLLGLEILGPSV